MEVEVHPCQIVHVETVLFTLPHSVPCKNPFTIFDNDSVSELMGIIQTMSPAIRYRIDSSARIVTIWKSKD